MEKIKVAVVGVGGISNAHIGAYINNPNVELYAFCDINPDQLKLMGERYGITRLYANEEQMLAELPEIDAVSVCTWNNGHADCSIKALKAGKHVLCEKPMAMNAVEAQAMLDEAKKSGKNLSVGFVRRFGKDAEVLKDLIDKDALGEVYYAKATYLRRNGNPGGWFANKALSGGGPLIDLGVHVIDLIRYLCGNPKPVSVFGATFNKLKENEKAVKEYSSVGANKEQICDVEDFATAMIRFDNGLVLQVETAFILHRESKSETTIQLFGTKGGVSLTPDLKIFTEWQGYLSDVTLDTACKFDFTGAFQGEINEFVDVAMGKAVTRAPATDGLTLMKILDAIYLSAKEQREVKI